MLVSLSRQTSLISARVHQRDQKPLQSQGERYQFLAVCRECYRSGPHCLDDWPAAVSAWLPQATRTHRGASCQTAWWRSPILQDNEGRLYMRPFLVDFLNVGIKVPNTSPQPRAVL